MVLLRLSPKFTIVADTQSRGNFLWHRERKEGFGSSTVGILAKKCAKDTKILNQENKKAGREPFFYAFCISVLKKYVF